MMCLFYVAGARALRRLLREAGRASIEDTDVTRPVSKRVLIVGAGDTAEHLIREIRAVHRARLELVGTVDDNPPTQHMRIHGVEVLGNIDQLPALSSSLAIDEIFVALPSATPSQCARVMQKLRESSVPVRTVPTLQELLSGKRITHLSHVGPEDLLDRRPVTVSVGLKRDIDGKRVLVTGAGGSIGGELARQLALLSPELLVLYDRAESSVYYLQTELARQRPDLSVIPVVGDILDRALVREVMQRCSPHFVYHAAAYKHVPLMEDSPLETIRNNVIGTENVAEEAEAAGVKTFVLISTDKAVKPVGVMGKTKRLAELLISTLQSAETAFCAVRFGNVLGSNGSVLPLFQWQISNGGPVTITDREAARYFMLIAEAARLVLQAGSIGRGGEVFFLDMGEPVKVVDLAQDLIRLSGYSPGRDIAVTTIGLRPGERLREQLVLESEELRASACEKIWITSGSPDLSGFRDELDALKVLLDERNAGAAVQLLNEMATRY